MLQECFDKSDSKSFFAHSKELYGGWVKKVGKRSGLSILRIFQNSAHNFHFLIIRYLPPPANNSELYYNASLEDICTHCGRHLGCLIIHIGDLPLAFITMKIGYEMIKKL